MQWRNFALKVRGTNSKENEASLDPEAREEENEEEISQDVYSLPYPTLGSGGMS